MTGFGVIGERYMESACNKQLVRLGVEMFMFQQKGNKNNDVFFCVTDGAIWAYKIM